MFCFAFGAGSPSLRACVGAVLLRVLSLIVQLCFCLYVSRFVLDCFRSFLLVRVCFMSCFSIWSWEGQIIFRWR